MIRYLRLVAFLLIGALLAVQLGMLEGFREAVATGRIGAMEAASQDIVLTAIGLSLAAMALALFLLATKRGR